MFGLETNLAILLIICLLVACIFEFINGFHDTANAVATVIYTNSLKPQVAVIWSGLMNFIGVNIGGIAVAVGIINLLPTEILVDKNIYHSITMIMSLILTAVIWNLGTWYFGIPCSSSHTLLGSIFGVGLAYMLLPGSHDVSLNWSKVGDVGLSLLISPLFGFGVAMLLMLLLQKLITNKLIFKEPNPKKTPPLWIRSILILTCTSVSFFHGSNDGQKGVGLIMLILIGIVPFQFAINTSADPQDLFKAVNKIEVAVGKIDSTAIKAEEFKMLKKVKANLASLSSTLTGLTDFKSLNKDVPFEIRKNVILITKNIEKVTKNHTAKDLHISKAELKDITGSTKKMKEFTEYAPQWVMLMVALSLGIGTMVGWKRIVVTIGEKIGKSHLTYAQGASAEIVAASTIGVSTAFGLPVSTTHVLSSGIAGSMVSGGGLKNLQPKTIKSIAIAWLITLPVTILLAGTLFMVLRLIFV